MTERATPRTRRGADAVQAAIEEFELRQRLDESGPEQAAPGDYDLAWAHTRIDTARRAAEADVITADEALEWLAEAIGRELPGEEFDEDYDRG
jgi:hypothetical protein